MEIFGEDFIFGDFRASDEGFTICSFENTGDSDDELFAVDTTEEFISENPWAVYEGQSYSFKLSGTITLMKDFCNGEPLEISEHECRSVLRKITGLRGYSWMRFITKQVDEDIWYKARVVGVTLKRIGGKPVGIMISIETNSYMSYSREYSYSYQLTSNTPLLLFINSDDLVNYLYPKALITPKSSGTFSLTFSKDVIADTTQKYITTLENVTADSVIQMDSFNKILIGAKLDDFNMHWIRFLSGDNELISNMDCTIQFIYRLPRKVGFICR